MKLYLKQLIYALHDSDIERLKKMDLRKSKMKTFIDLLIEHRRIGIPTNEVIMGKLVVDENSLKKMRSKALDRCLEELVPEGGIKLLDFLSQYRLSELFSRKADEIIEEIERYQSANSNEKAEIYLRAIQGYFRLPYSLFDSQKLNMYMEGFLKNYSKPDKPIIIEIIRLNEIFVVIVQSYLAMKLSEENYSRLLNMIEAIDERIKSLNNKRLSSFSKGLRLIMDLYFKYNWKDLQNGFKSLINEYNELNDPSAEIELFAVKFYQAYNEVMLSNYVEANRLMERLQKDYINTFHLFPHVAMRYALSLLIVGEKEKAKTVIDTCFNKNVLGFDPDGTIMYCISNIALCLLENKLDVIPELMELYQKVRNKKDLMIFETGIRLFEIIWFFQRGDEKFAAEQLKKFARYLKDYSKQHGTRNLMPLVKALSNIFNNYLKGKTSKIQFEDALKQLFTQNTTIAAVLFRNALKIRREGPIV